MENLMIHQTETAHDKFDGILYGILMGNEFWTVTASTVIGNGVCICKKCRFIDVVYLLIP